MERYYCNCCGCDFSASEGIRYHSEGSGVSCPMCGTCYYDEDDERYVERYNGDDEEDEIEKFKQQVDVRILDNADNASSFSAIIDSRRGIKIE